MSSKRLHVLQQIATTTMQLLGSVAITAVSLYAVSSRYSDSFLMHTSYRLRRFMGLCLWLFRLCHHSHGASFIRL